MLPRKALSNWDLKRYVKLLNIPNFRGVFMRNKLPKKINKTESGIVNLDSTNGAGTHWTAYIKNKNKVMYFDSYGNLRPPLELISYFKSDGGKINIAYNYNTYQSYNTTICGQLCLQFLYNNS